jgi:2-desacetyl-2-hydroxyethyl bacteriochlorophyllide A dehydrogenase
VIEERPVRSPGPGEVLIEVEACGICGSDLHAYSAGWPADGEVLGHETAGTVAEVGPDVVSVTVGQRVAVIPAVPCGRCDYCVAGCDNLCSAMRTAKGGFSTAMVVPAGTALFPLPDGVSAIVGSLLEPLAVAVRAVHLAELDPARPCVVSGLGPIGQCIVRVLRAHGATDIIGIDVVPARLEIGRASGARVIDARGGAITGRLRELVGGGVHRGYEFADVPLVFECSGVPHVVSDVMRGYVRPGGVVVLVALFEAPVCFDLNPVIRKEVSVRGSYAYTGDDCRSAFALIENGRVKLVDLVTSVVPLASIDEFFASPERRAEATKLVVAPHEG